MESIFFRYEVKFQNGMECGGAYVKLLSMDKQLNLVSRNIYHTVTIVFYLV